MGGSTSSTLQFRNQGRIICASTPSGTGGFYADLYGRVDSGEIDGGCAHHFTTLESNPTIEPEFLEAERAALGEEAFRQEYGAEFVAGGGSFFDADELRAVIGNREALPEDGRSWICAIDPSSGGGDPFACVVVGENARPGYTGRLLVGHVERWMPRKGGRLSRRTRDERDLWVDSVLDRVAAIARRFRATVISDQHLPGVVSDELRKRGVTSVRIVPWTAPLRSEAFQALRARVATERIEIANDDQLVAELLRVRTKFRAGASVVEIGAASATATVISGWHSRLELKPSTGMGLHARRGRLCRKVGFPRFGRRRRSGCRSHPTPTGASPRARYPRRF